MNADVMTMQEVAEYLQVSRKTICRYVWSGELEHVKIGRLVRIEEAQLAAFLDARRIQRRYPDQY